MTIWERLRDLLAAVGQMTGITPLVERIVTIIASFGPDRGPVAFTVALIALSAKMAKADGVVTADEVQAFRSLVEVPAGEERNVERLFDLAKDDTAGFEAYAARMRDLAEGDDTLLLNILDGLFHIATADAYVHPLEFAFLSRVGEIFGFDERMFARTAARHVRTGRPDPYSVLQIDPWSSDDEIKTQWRRLVMENHPDRHLSKGLPREALALLTDRLAQINAAYEAIRRTREFS